MSVYKSELALHEAECRRQGVLTPTEIRALRGAYDLSRAEFARVTGFGEATLARWERGEVVQNTSNDSFLRMLMDRDAMRRLSRMTQYEGELGREFSMVFHRLESSWAHARMRYQEFKVLFGSEERVRLLKSIGGGLFYDIQQMSLLDLMLRITRLTDPPGSHEKSNLTVRQLPDLCKNHPKVLKDHPKLLTSVDDLVEAAKEAAGFARTWRNKRITHTDRARATEPRLEPLPKANLRRVEAALDAVHAVLNAISQALLGKSIHNEVPNRPRALAFVACAKQLVGAVQYIDSIIDPGGATNFTDLEVAEVFLRKNGRKPTWQGTTQVIELREAAHGFRKNKASGRAAHGRTS